MAEAGIYIKYSGKDIILNVWLSNVSSNKNHEIQKVIFIQDNVDFLVMK